MPKSRKIPGALLLLAILVTGMLIWPWMMQVTIVSGSSMLPTLADGDRLLIDKFSYRIGKPERFDVVVFSYQYKPNTYYIKRVIGLPGETVRISREGVIYINGRALVEHYGMGTIQDGGLATNEVLLGEDEYFVLGDNRNFSTDSRDPNVANIRDVNIVGKAWICLYPATDRTGVLQ